MADKDKSLSGLSEDEAKEFHSIFVISFIAFTVIALIAHLLVWNWRPWGWAGMEQANAPMLNDATLAVTQVAQAAQSLV
jgi:light-harvesting complex 1 beta chain